MPDLGSAKLTLVVAGDKFKQGLATARKQTGDFAAKSEKQVGRVRGAFGKLGTGIKGAAGQVPILGGAMTALANPITAIAVGVGAVAVGLGKMVGRIVDAEKALRPMVERSGLASDSLQLLAAAAEKAGSEDGMEGVTDSAQELQLRLAEVVQDGTGPAKEAFEKLGISAQDLIDKSPEDMLLTVLAALQNVTNEADRKFLADELLGGSSEKLAGLLNLTNEELGNQLQHLADTGDFMSGEALADAKAYSASIDVLKNSFGSMATQIGSVLIPILTGLVEALNFIGKGLDWVGETLGFAKDDTNEFTEAADEMSETLAQGAAPAFEDTTEAAEDTTVEIAEVGKASQITTKSVETLTTATEEVTEATKLWAAANRSSSQQMIEDSALRLSNLLTDYAKDVAAQGQAIADKEQMLDDFLQAEIDKWTNHYQIQADLRAADLQDYIAGLAAAKDAGDGGNGGDGGSGNAALTNVHSGGGRTSGRFAGNAHNPGTGAITGVREVGGGLFFRTSEDGSTEFNAERSGRLAEAQAWLAANTDKATEAVEAETEATEVHTKAVKEETEATEENTYAVKEDTTATETQTYATKTHTQAVETELTPVEALTQLILERTQAEKTEAEAIAGLTPEIHAMGVELGLFGLRVTEVSDMVNNSLPDLGDLTHRQAAFDPRLSQAERDDAFEWALWENSQNVPGAQHGAAVRGSRYGSLVRVGENFTNENITPVGRNGGMGGGGSAPLYLSVKFGDTEVENVLVGKLDDLYRQRRINVDLTSS